MFSKAIGIETRMPITKTGNSLLWLLWIFTTMMASGVFAYVIYKGSDKTVFMPGPLSDGHHQLSDNCGACHTDNFGGNTVVLAACMDCHADERKKPFDSHPKAKFNDPRNADLLATIDATNCITCHTEHKPEITLNDGLTRPKDLCFHCHESIAQERPSHEGMGFETCTSAGCHNFHDNRALYTQFIIKNSDINPHKAPALITEKDFIASLELLLDYPRDHYPPQKLNKDQADGPSEAMHDSEHLDSWASSGHAEQGVNCSACHTNTLVTSDDSSDGSSDGSSDDIVDTDPGNTDWIEIPGQQSCAACHAMEADTFGKGKHGMKQASGLSPMTPATARIPMHEDMMHEDLTCHSCHAAHDYDVVTASVDACADCHADEHTLAYKESRHYQLWLQAVNGEIEMEAGVSCATCHMPRTNMDVDDYNSRIVVNHNQNASLSPNSKMIRPACLNCHSLEFSINSLADESLIKTNFQGQPSVHIESVPMARALEEAHQKSKASN